MGRTTQALAIFLVINRNLHGSLFVEQCQLRFVSFHLIHVRFSQNQKNHLDRKYLVTCENEGKIEEIDQCRQERMSKKDFMGEKLCQLCLRG